MNFSDEFTLLLTRKCITGQNEREESTQYTTVTQSAACASYESNYWRMQNICTTSDRLKRFVFQRCRLLLSVVIVENLKSTPLSQCKYATLYGYEAVA
jgi:hypothetical protein